MSLRKGGVGALKRGKLARKQGHGGEEWVKFVDNIPRQEGFNFPV